MMEYILGLVNVTDILLLVGSSFLFLALSSVLYRYWKYETIGMMLACIGLMPLLVIMLIIPTLIVGTCLNVPESWFSGLPAGEKIMMRDYIESQHKPITVDVFNSIQSDYSVKVHTKTDRARQEQRNKEAGPVIAKQLKAIGS